MATKILYGRSDDAWEGFDQFLMSLINEHSLKRVCEIGGGANPLLNPDYTAGEEVLIIQL